MNPLTAFGEDRTPAGLFSAPVDVGLLEELQLDELGRRSRWLPGDCLLSSAAHGAAVGGHSTHPNGGSQMHTKINAARTRAQLSRRERQRLARTLAFSRRTPASLPAAPAVALQPAELELIERLVHRGALPRGWAPSQLVEAWMIQSAWDYLQARGVLTNRFLLSTDGLNVKRSELRLRTAGRTAGGERRVDEADHVAASASHAAYRLTDGVVALRCFVRIPIRSPCSAPRSVTSFREPRFISLVEPPGGRQRQRSHGR